MTTLRKEIEGVIDNTCDNPNEVFMNWREVIAQRICSLIVERLEKIKWYKRPAIDVKTDIDNLIKEIKGCTCGEPDSEVVHRYDGEPCYIKEIKGE